MKKAVVVILIASMSLQVLVGWAVEDDQSTAFDNSEVIQTEDIESEILDKIDTEDEDTELENEDVFESAGEQTVEIEEQVETERHEEIIEENIREELQEFTEQEKDIETQEIEQPVTLVKQMVTITEGSYRIGGNNVNFDTSNTQPFMTEFNISPSKGGFISTPVNIRNTGDTELIIRAKSCVSIGSNTPRVVDTNKFRDWLSLGRKDTARYIALGLQVRNNKYWFNEEGNQKTKEIYVLQPNESINIELISKHGMSWTGTPTLKYNCLLEIEAIPTQKEITIEVAIEDNEQSVIEEITE